MPEFALPFLKNMAVLWFGGALIASILFRRIKGKSIISRASPDAVFHENWCSGRSLRNLFTRIGGARNCLMVCVEKNELVVTPNFPFTLMFLPEVFGLDVRVPVSTISAVEQVSGLVGRSLRITFAEEYLPPMELCLRDENGSIRHLGKTVANVVA